MCRTLKVTNRSQNIHRPFVLDSVVNFLTIDPNVRRSFHPKFDAAGPNTDHCNSNAVANDDLFPWSAGQDKHNYPSWKLS